MIRIILLVTAILMLEVGCEKPPAIGDPLTLTFSDLRVGASTRSDITSRLGAPHQTFENGRLLTYNVSLNDKMLMHADQYSDFDLVLLFDGRGLLTGCQLIDPGRYKTTVEVLGECT